MAATAPLTSRRRSPRACPKGLIGINDTLRRRAFEVLSRAVEKAIESASEDTLADIIGSHSDPRHALSVAGKDIAPDSSANLEAIKAAREQTAKFREEMAARAGGMLDRPHVAAMLGIGPAAVDKQRQRHQILGVPYGSEIRYPAAQFADGAAVGQLKLLLEAFGDTHPWEQLMLLTTPVEGFGDEPETIFQLLARRQDAETMRQLVALASGWAA